MKIKIYILFVLVALGAFLTLIYQRLTENVIKPNNDTKGLFTASNLSISLGLAQQIDAIQAGLDLKLGIEISPTYSAISASTKPRLIIVTIDETNGNNLTFYLHDGTAKHWVITQKIK